MPFNTPGNQSPGGAFRAAPYSRVFTTFAAARDLTAQVPQAPNASTGFLVNVTTGGNLVYKDCAGISVTVPLPIGVFDLFVAATSIEISTMVGTVLVYWHGTAAQ
jgi:hypothetical protein